MDIESHSQHPIINEVEVVSLNQFRPQVLRSRIAPLLKAQTVRELLDAVDPVARNLSALGNASFAIDLAAPPAGKPGAPLDLKTTIALANTGPARPWGINAITTTEMAGIQADATIYNRLGLGESLEFLAQAQPEPYQLGSGSVTASGPMPIGAGRFAASGFFFNQDRPWASYALASHGLSAKVTFPWWSARTTTALGVEASSRSIHSLGDAAGDAVRACAGSPSTKVAAVGNFTHEGEQHKLTVDAEVAGRPGDAAYTKLVSSLSGFRSLVGESIIGDVLVSSGYIAGDAPLLDRFVLGGAKDVYGFALNSIGPRDGNDFVGGTAFYSSRVAVTAGLPGKVLTPLRFTALTNVAALQQNPSNNISENVRALIQLRPAVSVAAGLTYRTRSANFEALYVLPVQSYSGDIERKGLHVGVGISVN